MREFTTDGDDDWTAAGRPFGACNVLVEFSAGEGCKAMGISVAMLM
jgi:hypothetical protein